MVVHRRPVLHVRHGARDCGRSRSSWFWVMSGGSVTAVGGVYMRNSAKDKAKAKAANARKRKARKKAAQVYRGEDRQWRQHEQFSIAT